MNIPLEFFSSAFFLFVLLNPFLMSIYLLDLIRKLPQKNFLHVLFRAYIISGVVFILFAWTGDAIFTDVLHVRFASFLIFGGLIFLLIGIQFMFYGSAALEQLRGSAKHIAGSIALPFVIGPATVSASVIVGSQLGKLAGSLAIVLALTLSLLTVFAFKQIHDVVQKNNELLIERYTDIVGRVSAFIIGAIAVEMILQGVEIWWRSLS